MQNGIRTFVKTFLMNYILDKSSTQDYVAKFNLVTEKKLLIGEK